MDTALGNYLVGLDTIIGAELGPLAFIDTLSQTQDDAEINLAIGLGGHQDDDVVIQLVYNARARLESTRDPMRTWLGQLGLPLDPMNAAFNFFPASDSDTVLGAEWRLHDPTPRATLYLEGIARTTTDGDRQRRLIDLAQAIGISSEQVPPKLPIGEDYIVAIDLKPRGTSALKRYAFVDSTPQHHATIEALLLEHCTPEPVPQEVLSTLFHGAPCRGHILQWRRYDDGQKTQLKIYKNYAYHGNDTAHSVQDDFQQLVEQTDCGPRALDGYHRIVELGSSTGLHPRIANCSVAFLPGQGTPHYVTGYWALSLPQDLDPDFM